MLACPPAGVLDGAPMLGVFPAGEFHRDPVGFWLDMLNGRAMAHELVEVPFQSDRSTRWTRRRRWVLKSKESIEEGETKRKKEKNGGRQRRGMWGAATMQKVNSPPQYCVRRMWLVCNFQ